MADIAPGDEVTISGKVQAIVFYADTRPTEYVVETCNGQRLITFVEGLTLVNAQKNTEDPAV